MIGTMKFFNRFKKVRLETYERKWDFPKLTWREWIDANSDYVLFLVVMGILAGFVITSVFGE